VHALQQLKNPAAVDALSEEALAAYEYLKYDESRSLARKCTWALADIETPDAKEQLQKLAQSNKSAVAAYVRRRLDKWDEEQYRKGSHS
jgi:HEAT repeat protein